MAVRTLKRRRLISRPKRTTAQQLFEQAQRKKFRDLREKYRTPAEELLLKSLTRKKDRLQQQIFGIRGRLLNTDKGLAFTSTHSFTEKGALVKSRQLEGPLFAEIREIEKKRKPLLSKSSISGIKKDLRHQRKRAIKGAKAIQAGTLPDSSWISELIHFPDTDKVHTIFEGRKYTFWNVPVTLFNAWFAGAAATTTNDPTPQRRWNEHDFPSLGAFFNQRIKNKYKHSRGWL